MADIPVKKIKEEIAAILKDADLATTSAKKVIQQMEKRLDADLSERRKEIGKLVMDYVNSQDDDDDDDEEEEAVKSEPEASSEEEKKKQSPEKRSSRQKKESKPEGVKKAKKSGGGGGGRGKGSGYTKAYRLSPALAKLMGAESMPRHEVVKRVWAIIKEKNLYDPGNKQFAICDDALYKVIGCKRFRTFGMMKYLKNHFYDE